MKFIFDFSVIGYLFVWINVIYNVSSLRDYNRFCQDWGRKGECTRNPANMKVNCALTCSRYISVAPKAPVYAASGSADTNRLCPSWASRGECQRNPNYMLVKCKRSCGVGGVTYGSWSSWSGYSDCSKTCGPGTYRRTRSCVKRSGERMCSGQSSETRACNKATCSKQAQEPQPDKNSNCPEWSKRRFCTEKSIDFMSKNCQTSCWIIKNTDVSDWCEKWNQVAKLCDENHKFKATNKKFMDKECSNECTKTKKKVNTCPKTRMGGCVEYASLRISPIGNIVENVAVCKQQCMANADCAEYNFARSTRACGLFRTGCTEAQNPDMDWYSCNKEKCTVCVDSNKSCKKWLEIGQCEVSKYKVYMMKNCMKSCGFCGSCYDKNDQCETWKANDQCEKNSDWMGDNCACSCKTCGDVKPTNKPTEEPDLSTPTDTITFPKPITIPTTKQTPKPKTNWPLNEKFCGQRGLIGRVVGGEDAKSGDWPWQVAILRKEKMKNGKIGWQLICGGSILNRKYILTAAHCFLDPIARLNAEEYQIRVGEVSFKKFEETEKKISITSIILHKFDIDTYNNDLAILKLQGELSYNAHVKPVCVPEPGHQFAAGKQCHVTGWGLKEEDTSVATLHLQEAIVPMIDWEVCAAVYSKVYTKYYFNVTSNMICAGHIDGTADACQGDSGGPLVCRRNAYSYEQAGVVSYGVGCARKGLYGLYTNLSNYIGWIREKMNADV